MLDSPLIKMKNVQFFLGRSQRRGFRHNLKWDNAHSEFETIRSISNLSMSFIRDHWKQRVRNENLLECIVPYSRVDAKVEKA